MTLRVVFVLLDHWIFVDFYLFFLVCFMLCFWPWSLSILGIWFSLIWNLINGYKDNESWMNSVTRLISNKNIATSVLIEYFWNLYFLKQLFVEVPAIKPVTISTVQNNTPPSVDVRMILVYAIAVPSVIAILTLLIFIVYQKKNDGKSGIYFRIIFFIFKNNSNSNF